MFKVHKFRLNSLIWEISPGIFLLEQKLEFLVFTTDSYYKQDNLFYSI